MIIYRYLIRINKNLWQNCVLILLKFYRGVNKNNQPFYLYPKKLNPN